MGKVGVWIMNYTKLNHIFLFMKNQMKLKRRVDLFILADLLESEIDDQEILKILGIDLKDEHQIRKILSGTAYRRYVRLSIETDARKALLVILHSENLSKKLLNQTMKALSYPSFLFFMSLIMMIFVNTILLPMFQSMLLFLGPQMNVLFYQLSLSLFILFDLSIIIMILMTLFIKKSNPYYLFKKVNWIKAQNIWSRLISYQFCEKFLYFYRLGGSIDEIFKQIQMSSDIVLNQLCFMVINELEIGKSLTDSINHIDSQLQSYFKMNDEGIDITKYLHHFASIQELIIFDQIKKYGKTVLAYSYIKITFMIVILYQVMLKPIEMMEKIL